MLKGFLQGDKHDVAKVCIARFYFSKINDDKNTFMYVCIYQNNHTYIFIKNEDNYIKTQSLGDVGGEWEMRGEHKI